ncbi:MAG: hypothetical protein K2Q23_16510 [Bryobacteraceae bacterium]|nr:hypothetical protein [Bryobacteraceae bacterium]
MRRNRFVTALAAALLFAIAGMAADPQPKKNQKLNGEITAVSGGDLHLKTRKTVVKVLLSENPKVLMGSAEMPLAALKQGLKVTVIGTMLPAGDFVAAEIRLPSPTTAPQTPMPSGHSGHSH